MNRRTARNLLIAAAIVIAVLACAGVMLVSHVFSRAAVAEALSKEARGTVSIRQFHTTFFPNPGCIAQGVTIRHDGLPQPIITISRLTVLGDYFSLLTFSRHLNQIRSEGMHIRVPPARERRALPSGSSKPSQFSIGALVADHVALEFPSDNPSSQPFLIQIHHVSLSPVVSGRALQFVTSLHLSTPPGEVTGRGNFGPWRYDDPFQTPVSGSYTFSNADLGHFEGIAGVLSSAGAFQGFISRIDVQGTIDVPDFEVKSAAHPVHLAAKFQATVNGKNGDTLLHPVQANFRQTTVVASGSIADHEKIQGKTVLLDLAVPRGRVDDLLRLFVHDPQPGMVGSLTCRAAAVLPPEDRRFIEKLRLHGDFAIARARFTSPNTQESLNKLSGRAEEDGKKDPDPPVALFDVHGRLALAEGVAGFSQSWFALPDVSGALGGTYNLVNERINLNGVLLLPITLSQTTTGIKSVILKFVDPFLKRKHHRGDKVPFKITGTYGHASVGLDLGRHHSL